MQLRSFSNESKWYSIDTEAGKCSCLGFSQEGHCKHLDAVGVYRKKGWTQSKYPTFSQALSGLVKSIRIRNMEDAIYWLVFLDTFKVQDKASRFRVARRILIGSAEDGMSIPIMERVAANFSHLCQVDTHIIELAAEVVRICKVPNWWDSSTGGHGYIRGSLVAYRQRELYGVSAALSLKDKLQMLEGGVLSGDVDKALLMFDSLMGHAGFSRAGLCDELTILAGKMESQEAARILDVHRMHKTPLSGDANFLGQALWWMVGGGFSVGESLERVTAAEVRELLSQARQRWQNPQPIPAWCCDGIHCGGTDRRYAGMVQDMDALCAVFTKYGNIDPSNEWGRDVYSFDGLITK